jgi:hypothetical protein
MLFPVRLVDFETLRDWKCFDADNGTDSAREIREYFIPDFSKWKDHDSYQEAFDRLLQDLKPEAERTDLTTGRADLGPNYRFVHPFISFRRCGLLPELSRKSREQVFHSYFQ